MGRINFECILSNIHLSYNTHVSTDLFIKLKPFIDMCDKNFLHVYKSNKNISVDEARYGGGLVKLKLHCNYIDVQG